MRFFHSSAQDDDCGCQAYVLVSPGHYGKSLEVALGLAETLRQKLRDAGVVFTDDGNSGAHIEIGLTDWDRGVMRVKLRIYMEMTADEGNPALAKAGFYLGLPDCL